MNEMLKPEMMRDMLPRETPKKDADESVPESGVRRSAEPRKPADAKAEGTAKAEAQQQVEDAFFKRGEEISAAHSVGEILAPNAAEKQFAENDALLAERRKRSELQTEIARASAGVAQAAEFLRTAHKIDDPEAALAQRAMGGSWGKFKSFFGRLGNAEQAAKDRALDTYDKMGKKLAEMQMQANEIDNRLNRPMMVRESKRLSAERGPR